MKLNRILTMCAVAATLIFSAASTLAQDNGGGGGGGGGGQGGDQGGGGQRRFRGGGGGGGNFDPAQMQQRVMDALQTELGFTNDTDWDAVKPLVQKVLDATRDAGQSNPMRAIFRARQREQGGDQGGGNNQRQRGGGFFGQQSAEQQALQQAIDDNAPAGQVKDLLAKAKAAQKTKQEALEQAKANLKAVLTSRQEAQAYIYGLVD